ncbi:AraC-like ligand-binding domain-containing protein [Burkholderia cenocepacia]|uniref:AraC-like ligand-binding domain-containing protein n=1 Tax=Burkholderia cenocepacia TaxID=95486 RepID=UPI002AB7667B|nr:hypothetical protein [Burkholderia cenocepacia]
MHHEPDEAATSFSVRRNVLTPLREFLDHGYGLHCEQSDERPCTAEVEAFAIGEARLTDVRMSALTLSPRHKAQSDDGYLYVKLVESGSLLLEQNGERCRLPANSLAIVDPAIPFTERFDDTTHLIVIHFPKAALRARGFHCHFGHWMVPDMRSPDVMMIHDMIRFVASRQVALGNTTRALLGTQLIDLMGVLVDAGHALPREALYRATSR